MRALALSALVAVACGSSSGGSEARPVAGGSGAGSAVEPAGPPPTATPGAALPEVPMVGYVVADGVVAAVAASRSALTVDGVQVGGVAQLAAALQHATPRGAVLAIAADAELPVSLVVQIIEGIAPPGAEVSLLARSGAHQVRVPVLRPPAAPPAGLGMIVTVSADAVALWSMSKQEGSAGEPKVAVRGELTRAATELSTALTEIVKRRWAGGAPRAAEDTAIVVEVAPGVPLKAIADVLGAVRATADGNELFPRVVLTTATN